MKAKKSVSSEGVVFLASLCKSPAKYPGIRSGRHLDAQTILSNTFHSRLGLQAEIITKEFWYGVVARLLDDSRKLPGTLLAIALT